jgi:hypothetical protein
MEKSEKEWMGKRLKDCFEGRDLKRISTGLNRCRTWKMARNFSRFLMRCSFLILSMEELS